MVSLLKAKEGYERVTMTEIKGPENGGELATSPAREPYYTLLSRRACTATVPRLISTAIMRPFNTNAWFKNG